MTACSHRAGHDHQLAEAVLRTPELEGPIPIVDAVDFVRAQTTRPGRPTPQWTVTAFG
jgi:hypothetical protein